MASYSYADCLQKSYRVNWRIGDVVDGRRFDGASRWLPSRLSGAGAIACLTGPEKIKLTHVEMGAYAHLFGYVEEYIAPKVASLARDFEIVNREAFDALINFAAEEVKHMALFREIGGRVNEALGFPLALLANADGVARTVLSKQTGAVLLLTSAIEWFTQLHYLTCFKDDQGLDAFTREIFKAHWLEESQHARMDHLETLRAFASMSEAEKDCAVDDLIDLVGAVDGLLQQQSAYDVENLGRYLGRAFAKAEEREVYGAVLSAKRYAFIESGVTHPNFQELFGMVTTQAQQERVQKALGGVLQMAA